MVPPCYGEARCPISPDGVSYNFSQHHPGVASPSNSSDKNFYRSPGLSPGDWNVASPGSIVSPNSSDASWRSFDSSVHGSPLSAPAALGSSSHKQNNPPTLPSKLGNKMEGKMDTQRRVALEMINKRFVAKSSFELERERNAIRKANSLMNVTQGRSSTVETKKLMITNKKPVGRGVILPHGTEHLATSTWKSRERAGNQETKKKDDEEFEESVDDFKCELDRDREAWAQKQALKMVKGARNFL
ncbi:hypothetical protein IV203_026608 [Nitzschia inconspicua]|uniref:Uncharacterized protein n=1 Tax=Nitzschia inconspicua TaxID=303405 RepID=A0A9K3LJJ5_9STRA|nr:hypothetical protein IV203_026608 [Nitzschia inconspicua]